MAVAGWGLAEEGTLLLLLLVVMLPVISMQLVVLVVALLLLLLLRVVLGRVTVGLAVVAVVPTPSNSTSAAAYCHHPAWRITTPALLCSEHCTCPPALSFQW